MATLAGPYLTEWAKPRKRSWEEDERRLNAYVIPVWGERKVKDITRADVDALVRDHNATLLSEKKQLQRDYTKLQEDHATATATLQRLQLDGPVDALIATISTDPKLFKALFAEGHKFALDGQGRPCVQTADGKPVMVKDAAGKETALPFDGKAIADYLCPRDVKSHTVDTKRWAHVLVGTRASGSGATVTNGIGYTPTDKPKSTETPAVQFGLR